MMHEKHSAELYIGCCGAYCRTCIDNSGSAGTCKGCRLGYEDGSRNIDKARCQIKRCCLLEKKLPTCMQCDDFDSCPLLLEFYSKLPRRQKIQRAAEFIREHGVEQFLKIAEDWSNSTGELP